MSFLKQNKTVINHLLNYVQRNQIEIKNNQLLLDLVSKNKTVNDSTSLNLDSIYGLVKEFERAVDMEDQSLNGAFFTPEFITDYIVSSSIKSKELTVLDPSCGCGAILLKALDFYYTKFELNPIFVIENLLFGVDIIDYNIERAKILLSLYCIEKGFDVENIKFNLFVGNSLEFDWYKKFNQSEFDLVLGNPPYVKYQDLPLFLRKSLKSSWQTLKEGNYNLYFAFFELGLNLLKKEGELIYITPNNYFTSLSGELLRIYFNKNSLISKIIDFGHKKVFEAQTYTCLTHLKKGEKKSFEYRKVENFDELKSDLNYNVVEYSNLDNKKWRLLSGVDLVNISKIESQVPLGTLFDIKTGIATCKDSVYFVDSTKQDGNYYLKEYQNIVYKIEKALTKDVVKVSDYKNQKELDGNKRRIIYPYQLKNNKISVFSELELSNQYPESYKYLLACKDELSKRDKGLKNYPEWFSYARTQGLGESRRKLLTPTFSKEARFLIDENSLFCNGYAISNKILIENDLFLMTTVPDIDILQKILNSSIMNYYIKLTSVSIEGGFPCFQKNFIEKFGIPTFTSEELEFFAKLTNTNRIDEFLIQKYGLDFTSEESISVTYPNQILSDIQLVNLEQN